MSPVVQMDRLTKKVQGKLLLNNISTEIREGEVVVILGPSGAGKSTFLKVLCGLEDFDSGHVAVRGEQLVPGAPRRRCPSRVGLVAQGYQLFPHLSCAENIALAPVLHEKMKRAEALGHAERLLDKVGLERFSTRSPLTLSAGQQQRVAIARALAMEPEVLLFDEPTSALDPEMTAQVLSVMKSLAEGSMTLLIVTHHIGFARGVASRIFFIEDGKLTEDADKSTFFKAPKTARARQFLEVLKAEVVS